MRLGTDLAECFEKKKKRRRNMEYKGLTGDTGAGIEMTPQAAKQNKSRCSELISGFSHPYLDTL